jgi:hypothetical protein
MGRRRGVCTAISRLHATGSCSARSGARCSTRTNGRAGSRNPSLHPSGEARRAPQVEVVVTASNTARSAAPSISRSPMASARSVSVCGGGGRVQRRPRLPFRNTHRREIAEDERGTGHRSIDLGGDIWRDDLRTVRSRLLRHAADNVRAVRRRPRRNRRHLDVQGMGADARTRVFLSARRWRRGRVEHRAECCRHRALAPL